MTAVVAVPRLSDRCCRCRRRRGEIPGELSWLDGEWICRDRVDCYRAWRRP